MHGVSKLDTQNTYWCHKLFCTYTASAMHSKGRPKERSGIQPSNYRQQIWGSCSVFHKKQSLYLVTYSFFAFQYTRKNASVCLPVCDFRHCAQFSSCVILVSHTTSFRHQESFPSLSNLCLLSKKYNYAKTNASDISTLPNSPVSECRFITPVFHCTNSECQ